MTSILVAVASLIFLTTVTVSFPIHGCCSDTSDPVWRMVTGAKTSNDHFYEQPVDEPLVYFNGSSSVVLQTILKSVCDLLSFQEMLSRVDNSSDMYLLLTQNTVDSCAWLNSLVTENVSVIGSNAFLLLPDTCAPNNTPRLHEYCLQLKAGEPDKLSRNITDELSSYYPELVTEEHQCQWLNSTDITTEARNRIGADFNCSF